MIYLSIIIPLKNEFESLPDLYRELKETLDKTKNEYEVIFIDDGSTDGSRKLLEGFKKQDKNIKVIGLRANFGKSYALDKGFSLAEGEIIITMDADLQDNPNDISKLIAKINEGYDLVSGWRRKRADRRTKRISSRLFNGGTSLISGVHLHDFNCGIKAFKKEVAEELHLRGELHRFVPVLAAKNKFKVTEIIVDNRKRSFGKSKYGSLGLGRSWRSILDLLTAVFISDFAAKPAHFFGAIGLSLFSAGFLMDAYVTYIKILSGTTQGKIPLLIAGVFFMLLGVQLLSTGLIAEMISYYFIKEEKSKTEQA